MEYRDYYQSLGVGRDATAEDIKRAYRRLARKYHPDVSKEKDAERRMQEVNEAHAVLSDPEKRAAYDQLGRHYRPGQEFRPPPGWDTGFEFSSRGFGPEAEGFSDFFAEIFGRMGPRGGARGGAQGFGRGAQRAAGDHRAKIELDLEDALTGATRQVSLRVPREDPAGRVVLEERTLNVRIPKGIREGQSIRLSGQGGAGGGRAGDLLLEVRFRPHPRLRADGRDLHCALPVAPWEAALGAVVEVALPGGALNVRVPEGSQSGGQLRIRGKGLPADPPGDLYIELRIVNPPADTPQARALFEKMRSDLAFDPRAT